MRSEERKNSATLIQIPDVFLSRLPSSLSRARFILSKGGLHKRMSFSFEDNNKDHDVVEIEEKCYSHFAVSLVLLSGSNRRSRHRF